MRNYCKFAILSGQVGGSPTTAVAVNIDAAFTLRDSYDPGSITLDPTEVWMPNSKEYFQYWINQALGNTGYSFGTLQPPYFLLESPRGTGKFDFPGYPTITFGTK